MVIGKKRGALQKVTFSRTATEPFPQMTSHEAVCILNAGDEVLQHTGRDSRQAESARLSTIAYAGDE